MKYRPTTWKEIHNAYCAKVRGDDDDLNGPSRRLIAVHPEIQRDRRNEGRREQVPLLNRERHQPYITSSHAPPPRHADALQRHVSPLRNDRGMPPLLSAHNFCVSPSKVVYALEKLGNKVQWPVKMKSNPATNKIKCPM